MKLFYGWIIAFCALLVLWVTNCLTGSIHGWTGSYQAALTLVAALIFLALLAATQVEKYEAANNLG